VHPNYFSFLLSREKYNSFFIVLEVARVNDLDMIQLLSKKVFLSDGPVIHARLVIVEATS
jgi:hypothetical protein